MSEQPQLGSARSTSVTSPAREAEKQAQWLSELENLLDECLPTRREVTRRDRDFIQFRTTFFNNYDFQVLRDTARQIETLDRTGSRSTTWKLLLGVLPLQRNKELWIRQLH